MTMARLNKYLEGSGLILYRGEGYFYFEDIDGYIIPSIYVYRVSELTKKDMMDAIEIKEYLRNC